MELFKAHYQWANRPADQRFASLCSLYDATRAYAATAKEKFVPFHTLRVSAEKGEVVLTRNETPAHLTHWAFGQLCERVGAPASYLRDLPATLAAQNLLHGLKLRTERNEAEGKSPDAQLLLHQNGGLLCRSLNGSVYERVWNWELAQRLLTLEQQGWEPARPDFRKKDDDFPALYASDHDLFAFIRLPNVTVQQPVAEARSLAPMYRGAIYENSEVGAKAIRVTKFWYNGMCGNHIIWGASDVTEFSAVHVGRVRARLLEFDVTMRLYAEESASDDEATFARAATKRIAATKDELLDRLFGIRQLRLTQKTIAAAYDAVKPEEDGDPLTVWGMVQGMTRHSQTIAYADERATVDRSAGALLDMVDAF